MSLVAERVVPLNPGLDIVNFLKKKQTTPVQEPPPRDLATPAIEPKQKKAKEQDLSPFEALREKHELSRRNSVKGAIGLLEVRDTIKDLEGIAKERSRDNSLGFKPTKNISPSDETIGQIAQGLSSVLGIYPSPQNMQVAEGFMEMVGLIDGLESIAQENTESMGFKPSSVKASPLQEEAAKSARELRAKIPYILEWLETPNPKITTKIKKR